MPIVELETIKKLFDQIGTYHLDEQHQGHSSKISATAGNALYQDCPQYTMAHNNKIKAHNPKHAEAIIKKGLGLEPNYFRMQFLQHVITTVQKDTNNYSGSERSRETDPESATISMRDLFGKQGQKLYKKALEEEAHDANYRDAVFNKSAVHIKGQKFSQRPVAYIAGPSGCGKTFVSKAKGGVLDKISTLMPLKKEDAYSGNSFVFVDGGIVREMSQIRKLAIYASNLKGYTGKTD